MGAGHHHHGHGHHHGPAADRNRRGLTVTLVLAFAYMIAEVVGGIASNSLALLADAGHMLSDVGALALSLFAFWIARRPATPERSYGWKRTEILVALLNGATLIAIAIVIMVEAWQRMADPPSVRGPLVMAIAVGGLLVNLGGMWALHGGKDDNLNVRGAWLHLLSDALGSVGTIVAGLLVWWLGWLWADPVVSVVIALLVVWSSWALIRESVQVLLEGTPGHIDLRDVRMAILAVRGVREVHDLHVWTITSGMEAMSGHVVVDEDAAGLLRPPAEVLAELHGVLHERFGLHHMTIQLEPPGFTDGRCPPAGCW